jgi:molecular chaperone GrpE
MSTQDNDDAPTLEPEQAATAEMIAQLDQRWRRAVADADNMRKRCARQVAEERSAERDRVAAEWLPVVDNLERALEHAPSKGDPVIDGVRAVRDQAVEVLARLGFPRHDEIAVPFDPFRHEAVAVVTEEGTPPGAVVRVVRPGYGDGDHILRPAAVVVAGDRS